MSIYRVQKKATNLVHNFLKVYGDLAIVKVRELRGVMNKSGELALSHLAGTKPKDKEKRVNDV